MKMTMRTALAGGIAMSAAAALVLVPTSVFATSTPTDGESTSGSCQLGSRVIALWAHAPADLKADLKELRALPPEERRAAAAVIKQGAIDGTYGEGVQQRAERLRERRVTSWTQMPDALQQDLRELAAAEPGERRDLAVKIGDTALAGGYGDRAQAIAERVQEQCSK